LPELHVVWSPWPYAAGFSRSGPILIDATVRVRVREFEPGLLPGTPRSEGYLRLASSLVNFSSDLLLVVLHNFGAGGVPANVVSRHESTREQGVPS
jgi:hypothetical protein